MKIMKRRKFNFLRLTSMFLTFALLLCFAADLNVVSADETDKRGFKYSVYNEEAEITGYTGTDTEIKIPSKLGGYPVTSIGNSAFDYCTSLTSITIHDGVESIGKNAFSDCSSLTNITIPDSVTSIGYEAFLRCNSLTSITIPNDVTSIGGSAFRDCHRLSSVTIGNGVTSISSDAFKGCVSLMSIKVSANNKNCSSIDGVLFNKDKTEILMYPKGKSGAYTIPNRVTSIGNYAFYDCRDLTNITIPGSVTSIGESAFSDCYRLSSITIPDSVTSIGKSAFSYCYRLSSITIPDSVTNIGESIFTKFYNPKESDYPYSTLETVYYEGSETDWNKIEIGKFNDELMNAKRIYGVNNKEEKEEFYLTYKVLDNGTASITGYPDKFKDVGSIDIPKEIDGYKVTAIAGNSFNNSDLTSIKIANTVKSIGSYAFSNCKNLKTASIPKSVTSIDSYAFTNSGLTSVKIPEKVTSIAYGAFMNCTSLKKVTIPKSVKTISEYAFSSCSNIKEVYYAGNKTAWKKVDVGSNNSYLTNAKIIYGEEDETSKRNFTDSDTKIKVELPEGSGLEDADFVADEVDGGNFNISDQSFTGLRFYEIHFKDKNGKQVQPKDGKKIKVSMPIPVPLPKGVTLENLQVMHVKDGRLEPPLKTTIKDGYIIFETDHFSVYAIVAANQKEQLNDWNGGIYVDSLTTA